MLKIKLIKLSTEKLGKNFSNWILSRKYRLILFILVLAVLRASDTVPYVNLIVNPYLIVLIAVVLCPLILDIDPKPLFIIGTMGFLLAALLWFMGQIDEAETLGEYVFIVLISGTLKAFLVDE